MLILDMHKRAPRNIHPQKVNLDNWQKTVRRMWNYLSNYRWKLLLVFGLTVVTTAVTIIGNRMNGIIVDQYIDKNRLRALIAVCIFLAIIYFISSIFTYFQNSIIIKVAQATSNQIRQDVFGNLQRLPMKYFDTHDNGDIMSRLTNDVDNINTALMQSFIQLFTGVISVIGMGLAMLILSPVLTLIAILSTVATYLFSKGIAKLTQKAFLTQQDSLGKLNTQIEETISGKQIVQLFNHTNITLNEFNRVNSQYTKAAFKAQALSSIIGPFNNMTNNIAYLLITAVGAILIIGGFGNITVGIIFTFLIYLRNFTGPINNVLNLINTLQLSLASAQRVFQLIDEEPEKDSQDFIDLPSAMGHVEFENVYFAYDKKMILKNINIVADPGEVIALVGPTGAGKTTIMNLLTNLYPLQKGRVLLDGHDVIKIKRHDLRHLVTVVQQESFLFNLSIRENIRLGRPNASDEEVISAAKAANADKFIEQLPNGYETILSENASQLSQGQRQLLSIARAFIAKSPVLVLDEATASIDSQTEVDVQRAMTDLMKDKTSFVIAHRLSTIKNADKILVIDHGQIIEKGTHQELLAKHGFYARMYNSQFD
ncbi:ABC transporter ATP-binding protein [Companilactobacillus pabuli]|jgi:ATP-binding cassette subfamily B protein|uniref:ABC transporter ATP-binding protein n=2 Tax=Companilactobacillus pabuli TaxID=2714036 RepID=A0A7L7KWC9_9LACO|nr:ABC transporter ATP-binding protein [Companilactobacillus pabuli]AKP03871.1 multidrug ABC transporter ATP-binding protein [Companilactobacillus farciminis]AKS52176.1 multidrug ABC transporter ATP-binding protein [Companilactobacillus farciminis]QMT84073.1 ABC transporter ATP-binding protein [Companilactobacillus pabuli]